jgi:CBS domain-containing protein
MPLREAGEMRIERGAGHVVVVDVDVDARRPLGVLSNLVLAGVVASGQT